jgi:hypothetical protein
VKPKIVEAKQFKNFNINNFQHDPHQAFDSMHLGNYTDANTAWHAWKEIKHS